MVNQNYIKTNELIYKFWNDSCCIKMKMKIKLYSQSNMLIFVGVKGGTNTRLHVNKKQLCWLELWHPVSKHHYKDPQLQIMKSEPVDYL